jgi:hypothetical protein
MFLIKSLSAKSRFAGRIWIGVSFIFFAAFPLSGAAISVIVAETGVREETPVSESSNLWESGLLDGFFDRGHIVSNAPIARLDGKTGGDFPGELKEDLREALAGGMEFIVLVLLDYEGYSGPDTPRPRRISVRLFQLKPLKLITEQRYRGGDVKSPGEVFDMAKNTAGMILPHLANN